jgi:hypothetical protein
MKPEGRQQTPREAALPKTFISYRKKSETGVLVNQLAENLRAAGLDPFLDRSDIQIGAKYAPRILKALAAADIVIVLIGETWLTVTDSAGKRRLDDPEDWVRREIELAQQLEKQVAVVLFDVPADFELGLAADPVPEVKALSAFQSYRIAREYIDRDVSYLCGALGGARPRSAGGQAPRSPLANHLLAMAGVLFLAMVGLAFAMGPYPSLPSWLPAFPGTGSLSACLFWMCVRAGVIQPGAVGAA